MKKNKKETRNQDNTRDKAYKKYAQTKTGNKMRKKKLIEELSKV